MSQNRERIASNVRLLGSGSHHRYPVWIGERIGQQGLRRIRIAWKRSVQQTAGPVGRRRLEIVVSDNGWFANLNDLAEISEVGDWKMPDFKAACSYTASQGWLIAWGDMLTLTTARLAAA